MDELHDERFKELLSNLLYITGQLEQGREHFLVQVVHGALANKDANIQSQRIIKYK